MDILYTCDNNYVWIMGISVISLFENNKHIEDLTVYLLGENISDDNKNYLGDIAWQYSRKIEIINVPKLDIAPSIVSERWPLSAYIRLFSGQLLPGKLKRILYLDCDTVITGDIEPLGNIQFNGKLVLGVKDCISGLYKKNIGLDVDSPYINAGVLIIDLDALRKIKINVKIEDYMSRYVQLINYADQDILNGVFNGEIGEINPKYNVMTINAVHSYSEIIKLRKPVNFYAEKVLKIAVSNPIIIHYTTNMLVVRPWYSNTNHPFACEFDKYMQISPWKNKKLVKMVFNSRESKVISVLNKLPHNFATSVLGIIHSELRPRYIRLKAKIG